MTHATLARKPDPERLAELQSWYIDRMRPKLMRAASEGSILPVEVLALDGELRRMLELPVHDEDDAPVAARG
jgi:hypothetical protein